MNQQTSSADLAGEPLEALYRRARQALDAGDEAAATYYDQILQREPDSWEAAFFAVYCRALETSIAGIVEAAGQMSGCLEPVLDRIRRLPEDRQAAAVDEVADRVAGLSDMYAQAAASHYGETDPEIQYKYLQDYRDRLAAARDLLYAAGDRIAESFPQDRTDVLVRAAECWEAGVERHRDLLTLSRGDHSADEAAIESYIRKAGQFDRPYLAAWEREQTRSRLEEIDKTIAATDTMGNPRAGKLSLLVGIAGVLLIALGIQPSLEAGRPNYAVIIGVIYLAIDIFLVVRKKPSKAAIAANVQKVQELEVEKQRLQERLAQLEAELED